MDNSTVPGEFLTRPLNVWGLVSLIVFYLATLALGVFASIKNKTLEKNDVEGIMLAGRSVGPVVGIFTMTATWVGGGYINGTAEFVFTPGYGLAWTQAMWGFSLSLILGGIFFAKPMRAAGYVTMLDPFRVRYGRMVAALMYLPAMLGELFWSGAILSALGASLVVILGVSREVAVVISTGIAVLYTVLGGLYSVVFTDVIQIFFIFVGLWIGVGFGLAHPAVKNIGLTAMGEDGWVGVLKPDPFVGHWLDFGLLLIFGGIPWQVYFQRVLSAKTPKAAQVLSFAGAAGCFFLAIPAILIGAIAKSADWNQTDYRLYWPVPIESENYPLILPLVLQYLTPPVVAIIGLGAVSAAVMSSADSSLLSSSSMFAWNVYRPIKNVIFKSKVGDRETLWVMRGTVVVLGALACVIAIKVNSIYALFVLCGGFVYVVAFPQLACVIYLKKANSYGALSGYFVSFFFRLTAGEPLLKFDPLIKYWYFDEPTQIQRFPIRTFAMLLGLITIIVVSLLTHHFLPEHWDKMRAIYNREEDEIITASNPGSIDELGRNEKSNGEKPQHSLEITGRDNPSYEKDKVQFVTRV